MRGLGFAAEERAAKFLARRGFTIIERNYHARVGEIDIVAIKNGVLHFVEVKSSKKYEPIERITPAKLERIRRTALRYMQQKGLDLPFQIDALVERGGEWELVENITF